MTEEQFVTSVEKSLSLSISLSLFVFWLDMTAVAPLILMRSDDVMLPYVSFKYSTQLNDEFDDTNI